LTDFPAQLPCIGLPGPKRLGDLAGDYWPELRAIIPRETENQKERFELLDYAYIGARYDGGYKITKEQLEQLGPCVEKLHEV
jgi:hypothetical protein